MILATKILGLAYVLSPLRITYTVEHSGTHCIPGSDATRNIRQLPCFANGAHLPASTHLLASALCRLAVRLPGFASTSPGHTPEAMLQDPPLCILQDLTLSTTPHGGAQASALIWL